MNTPQATPLVWSVTALVQAFSDTLNARFNSLSVRGEVSGLTRAASGHQYFNLKDGTAQLRCVMFRQRALLSGIALRDGMTVRLRATVSIFEPRGDLQLIVDSVQPDGEGALLEAFLRLKAKLQAEGLFDAERKRPLPAMPQTVGVVTSLQAAALRDVLTTLRRRSPQVRVIVYPASVQGAQAPGELIAALRRAQSRHETDLLLLVRGGGSLDDLWAFNDEALVRAIAASALPVVCGVGHETDFTLADFVADLRAPTPTAAAELGVPAQASLLAGVDHLQQRLRNALRRHLQREQQRCDRLALRWPQAAALLAAPQRGVVDLQWRLRHALARLPALHANRLQTLRARLQSLQRDGLRGEQQRLDHAARVLPDAARRCMESAQNRLDRATQSLHLLSPRATLARGYLIGLDADDHVLRHVDRIQPGQTVQLVDSARAVRVGIASAAPAPHPLDADIAPT
ncbi:exodeoxyribonuclease 7 large subunit [mine drainage metagenome]|uniref:Exodeoxyribonuclease 7 large subunit n=1 Tax=mine drainage metagenome TaxID=410659 RepID=A0A1J5QEZ4_9ZZZZ